MHKVEVRIGFVPSYRNSYTAWCQRMREESLAALASVEGVTVVAPRAGPDGVSHSREQGCVPHGAVSGLDQAETVAHYFGGEALDGLVICPLDFGDERSAAKIAEKLAVPVMLYATKEPPARTDASLARLSDSYCGNLSIASALYRRQIPFRYAGLFFPNEDEFVAEVRAFARAVSVVKGLKGARLGQVGVRPETFETVGYDEMALIRKFGQNVIYRNLADIVDRAQDYPDDAPEVQAIVSDVRGTVAQITVSEGYLVRAAKMELALAGFWSSNSLSAMAVQCWRSIQRMMGISLCAVYGRLTQQGMLTACEADVLGAASMLANYHAALGETVPHFVDWTVRHRQEPNQLLAWHCGNAPLCLAANADRTALRSRHDMKGELPPAEGDVQAGLYQFRVRPGPVTFCRLAEYDGDWKMLVATGEVVPSDEEMAGTWGWVAVRDHDALYRTLVEEGFIHHASMIHGDQSQILLQACQYLDIEPIVVA